MSKKTNLSAGRQALRKALRDLAETALPGRNRTVAIDEANRRLAQAGLAKLGPTTVGSWFEAGSPAKDFRSLWALVQILLEWSGQPSPDTLEGPARGQATARWKSTEELWKAHWEHAQDTRPRTDPPANAPLVTAYLAAVRDAARQHPYPGVPGTPNPPALADVYVRQQAHAPAADNQDSPSPSNATARGNQAAPAVPATEVFEEDRAMCVLLGGPGGGKSTLLRAHLANSADSWLGGTTGTTIPVMVSAAALTGTDPLPTALAKTVTGDLRQVGLLDELPVDFFRRPPRAGVSWLVLVDGLDEIPNANTRSAVVTMLACAAAAGAGLYRFVVATRPLPATELGALGRDVPSYELQPFSHDDLHTYATHWFQVLDDPGRHAKTFMTGLKRSRLDVLARTPLMAFMLCQLYAADPARPLPDGRTGAYQSFVELVYEQNTHKRVAATHDEVIRRLKDRHQVPSDNQAAEQAAEQVRDRLLELINHLAYERIGRNTAPAVEILASHLHVNRPEKVREQLWNSFLSDLLRPTGLLVQHADDFDFLHQTHLEYHAARHATRNEQARAQLLREMFSSGETHPRHHWRDLMLNSSYLGFLLDGLLVPKDRNATETARRIEELATHKRHEACDFLAAQVRMRTNLPDTTASQLVRLAEDTTLHGRDRMVAARGLAEVGGHREAGATLLARLANHVTLDSSDRVSAAGYLAEVEGHGEAGATLLARLAEDTTLHVQARVSAAGYLARMEGHREGGAALLARFAEDTRLDGYTRGMAARDMAQMAGQEEDAAALLARLAEDTTLSGHERLRLTDLNWMHGYREIRAALLARLAEDTTLSGHEHLHAARELAQMAGQEEGAAALLARLAEDTHGRASVAGIRHLSAAVSAAGYLARMEGQREGGAALLARLAEDTTLSGPERLRAARELAQMEGQEEDAAVLLARLAGDTTLSGPCRVRAAGYLAQVEGHREGGAALLARLAEDTTLDNGNRAWAARDMAVMEGHREGGAALLARLAEDTTLDNGNRAWAAQALARLEGALPEGGVR
ncbi:NACHT domain-containing protein [Streptomyces sp. NPDC059373]